MWMNAAQKRSRKGERLIGFQKILFYLLSVKFHIFSSIFIWINLKKAPKFQFAVRTTILVFILTFIKILFSSNANSCMENENKFFAGEKQMNEFRANRNSFRFFNMLINFLMKWEYTLGFTRWQFVNIYRWTEFCKFSDTKSYNIYDMFSAVRLGTRSNCATICSLWQMVGTFIIFLLSLVESGWMYAPILLNG